MKHKFINEIVEQLEESMYEVVREDEYPFEAEYILETDDGTITVWMDKFDDVRASVWHDKDGEEYDCPIIAEAVKEQLCTWSEIEDEVREDGMDEYQRNGFASAADFWHWKEGRW